jgi:glycosyltransferase involved in cell wall biosynthesis
MNSHDSRPHILIIADRPKWAIDYKTDNLIRVLGHEFHFQKKYQTDVTEADFARADIIQIYYWLQLKKFQHLWPALERCADKLALGVCSHIELEGTYRELGLQWLTKARVNFINNKTLYHQLFPLLPQRRLFYTPNGVDSDFFCPGPDSKAPHEKLRVGWAGSLTNQGPGQRGFYNLILPAVQAVEETELRAAIREEQWRSHADMQVYYRSLDVYLCASRNEGTPNPCLEAAACGVPIVTTRVGNMPEFIVDGHNGFFVEPTVTDIVTKLRFLRDNVARRTQIGQAARASALAWDWRILADNFRAMYMFLCGQRHARVPQS